MLLLLSLFSIVFNNAVHSCLFIDRCSNLDAEIVTLLLLLLLDLTRQLLASLSLCPII
jgi:hypothetical protein